MENFYEQRLIYKAFDSSEHMPILQDVEKKLEEQVLQTPEDVQAAARTIVDTSMRWIQTLNPNFAAVLKSIAITGNIVDLKQVVDDILIAEPTKGSEGPHAQEDVHLQIPEITKAIKNVGQIFSKSKDVTITTGVIIDQKGAILLHATHLPRTEDGKQFDFSDLKIVLHDGTPVDLENAEVLTELDGYIAIQPANFTRILAKNHITFTTNYSNDDQYYMMIPGSGARVIDTNELQDGVELSPTDRVKRINSYVNTQVERDSRLGSYAIVNQRGELITMTNPDETIASGKQGEAYTVNGETMQAIIRSVSSVV